MHTSRACLGSKITRGTRALASLAPLFVLALLLAWLLSAETALSFFQSPTLPPPPTETPLPTETPTSAEVRPTATPTLQEARPTWTPTPPPTEALTPPTPPPTEVVATPTLAPTEVVLMPTAQAAQPTVPPTEIPPPKGAISLWPWVLLGLLSLGAIAAGVFLLQREALSGEGEE